MSVYRISPPKDRPRTLSWFRRLVLGWKARRWHGRMVDDVRRRKEAECEWSELRDMISNAKRVDEVCVESLAEIRRELRGLRDDFERWRRR